MGIIVFQKLLPVAVRARIDFQDLRTATSVAEMSYLNLGFKMESRFEFKPHRKFPPCLKIIVTDNKNAFFADIVNQANKTMIFET